MDLGDSRGRIKLGFMTSVYRFMKAKIESCKFTQWKCLLVRASYMREFYDSMQLEYLR
jgi:hypothetical protein